MEALGSAIQSATEMQQDKRRGQGSLFGGNGDSADGAKPTAILPDVEEWPTSEKLKYEKEALDFYFSSHPLAQFEQELRLSTHRVEQIRSLEPNQEVFIGGMLTGIRYQNTKNARNGNSRYVRCKLEDLTGTVECIMWPDDFVKHSDQFQEDRACFVKGAVDTRARDEPGLVLRRVMSIDQAKKEMAKSARGLAIQIVMSEHSHSTISGLAQVLQTSRGACPVFLEVCDPGGNKARLRAGQEFSVNPTSVDVARLEDILGKGRVKLVW
jgi:DNA polymerase-3 subunit alpha